MKKMEYNRSEDLTWGLILEEALLLLRGSVLCQLSLQLAQSIMTIHSQNKCINVAGFVSPEPDYLEWESATCGQICICYTFLSARPSNISCGGTCGWGTSLVR